jgi:DNA-binding Xre family transcriptional regulator
MSYFCATKVDRSVNHSYNQNMSSKITTLGRITVLLGKQQIATGVRMSPRKLAQKAGVPKDFVYRLDAGEARHVDLGALARLCTVLQCDLQDILVWEHDHDEPL